MGRVDWSEMSQRNVPTLCRNIFLVDIKQEFRHWVCFYTFTAQKVDIPFSFFFWQVALMILPQFSRHLEL